MLMEGLQKTTLKHNAKKGQLWFAKEVATMRREFHRAEVEWLKCENQMKRKGIRLIYVIMKRRELWSEPRSSVKNNTVLTWRGW